MVVDKFHFDTNHTGKYCTLHCSPYKFPQLKHANMSVCEQRFKWLGKFSSAFRYMNRVRFNFMLLLLTLTDNDIRT
jgi:hypothetical protein